MLRDKLRAFVSRISPPVVVQAASSLSLEKFKNAALFLWLGLPSTLIRYENEAKPEECKNAALCV